jgi:hypothetical protein
MTRFGNVNRSVLSNTFIVSQTLVLALLGGCSHLGTDEAVRRAQPTTTIQEQIVTAYGTADPGSQEGETPTQNILLAKRASVVDAYRSLSERVYGTLVNSNTSVSSYTLASDAVSTYVNAYLQGAKILSTTKMLDGSYQTQAQLVLSHDFYTCLQNIGLNQHTSTCEYIQNTPMLTPDSIPEPERPDPRAQATVAKQEPQEQMNKHPSSIKLYQIQ